jgi:hypothetical protein
MILTGQFMFRAISFATSDFFLQKKMIKTAKKVFAEYVEPIMRSTH